MTTKFFLDILLHDHIDGSITVLGILKDLYKLSGLEMPDQIREYDDLTDLRHKLIHNWFGNPTINIVTKFGVVTKVMQNPDTLYLVGREYARIRSKQGYRYCEGTIAPQYHTRGDKKSKACLTEKEAINYLIEGVKAGEKEYPESEINILAAIGRELIEKGEDEVLRILREVSECDSSYVVGWGLVCDEAKYPPQMYIRVLQKARILGIKVDPFCPHTGEWANMPEEDPNSKEVEERLLDNIRTAVYDLGSRRVEHARLVYRDDELCGYMADNNIGVISCPGSYRNTGLIRSSKELNLDLVRSKGVRISLSPDDDLFQDDMGLVWEECKNSYGFNKEDELRFRVDAWKLRLGNRKSVPIDIAHLI